MKINHDNILLDNDNSSVDDNSIATVMIIISMTSSLAITLLLFVSKLVLILSVMLS